VGFRHTLPMTEQRSQFGCRLRLPTDGTRSYWIIDTKQQPHQTSFAA